MDKYDTRHKILELLEMRRKRDFGNIEPEAGTMQQHEISRIINGVTSSEIENQLLYLQHVDDITFDEPMPNDIYYSITPKGKISLSEKKHKNERKKIREDKLRFWIPTCISIIALGISLYSIFNK